jgi:50S ribosomal subunit-associated GTPase HflX
MYWDILRLDGHLDFEVNETDKCSMVLMDTPAGLAPMPGTFAMKGIAGDLVRAGIIVIVLDATNPTSLRSYDMVSGVFPSPLSKNTKFQLVVNKCDEQLQFKTEQVTQLARKIGWHRDPFYISAKSGHARFAEFVTVCWNLVHNCTYNRPAERLLLPSTK